MERTPFFTWVKPYKTLVNGSYKFFKHFFVRKTTSPETRNLLITLVLLLCSVIIFRAFGMTLDCACIFLQSVPSNDSCFSLAKPAHAQELQNPHNEVNLIVSAVVNQSFTLLRDELLYNNNASPHDLLLENHVDLQQGR